MYVNCHWLNMLWVLWLSRLIKSVKNMFLMLKMHSCFLEFVFFSNERSYRKTSSQQLWHMWASVICVLLPSFEHFLLCISGYHWPGGGVWGELCGVGAFITGGSLWEKIFFPGETTLTPLNDPLYIKSIKDSRHYHGDHPAAYHQAYCISQKVYCKRL